MPKRTILVAWEMGGGLGHIQRLAPVAKRLADDGHRVVFAFREPPKFGAFPALFPTALVVRAPFWQRAADDPPLQNGPASNFPDVLLRCGYHSEKVLGALVQDWHRLFAQTDPALILCDQSPTVILAAAGRIPVVHIGCGFAIPPIGQPALTLHPASAAGAAEREAVVLDSIAAVQRNFGGPVPASVSHLLGFAENIPCCLPELDPYRAVRPEPAPGPADVLPEPKAPADGIPLLFGYLAGEDARVPGLLKSLAAASIVAEVFVRHPTLACHDAIRGSKGGVRILEKPVGLAAVLAKATAVLHHGGLATAEVALAIGRPQFVFPRHLEQSLTADALVSYGCGLNLRRERGDAGELIRRAMERRAMRDQAVRLAAQVSTRPAIDVAAKIFDACRARLS